MRKLVDREGQPRLVRRAVSGCLMLLLAATIAACTENPLGGDDQITGGRRDISGEVVLSDSASPEGVVVWLQDANLLARTNAAGRFRLTLPPQPEDQTSGTISEHTLFVYLANYQLATARVAIVDGAFYYNHGDIDQHGSVRTPIRLQRALAITTTVSKPEGDNALDIVATLQTDLACVSATNPKIAVKDRFSPVDTLGAVLLSNLDSGEITIVRSNPFAEGNEALLVCRNHLQRQIRVDLSFHALPAGRYRAYPYILVEPKEVPVSLLARIGQVNTLQSSYLRKPMRWQGGEFVLGE